MEATQVLKSLLGVSAGIVITLLVCKNTEQTDSCILLDCARRAVRRSGLTISVTSRTAADI